MEWLTKDVSKTYRLSVGIIRKRAKSLGIAPVIKNNRMHHHFTKEQVYQIVNYPLKISKPNNVIYSTQTIEVYHSLINFDKSLDNLNVNDVIAEYRKN